jgi:hypothetical protein
VRSSDPIAGADVRSTPRHLDAVTHDVAAGATVTFARGRLGVRRLPFG